MTTAESYYMSERSAKTTGNVGILNPSDYMYIYANQVSSTCFNTAYYCKDSAEKRNGYE